MSKERRIGLFVLGIVVLAGIFAFVLSLAHEQKTLRYVVEFKDAKNLKRGDLVQMNGVEIGLVSSVNLVGEEQIDVELRIEPEHARKVMQGSTAIIKSPQLMDVSGQMIVEIHNPDLKEGEQRVPMERDSRIQGVNSTVGLLAWKSKDKLGNSGEALKKAGETLKSMGGYIGDKAASMAGSAKDLATNPKVHAAAIKLWDFAKTLKDKGVESYGELKTQWPEIRASMNPVLQEIEKGGRHVIAREIRQMMEDIEDTLALYEKIATAVDPNTADTTDGIDEQPLPVKESPSTAPEVILEDMIPAPVVDGLDTTELEPAIPTPIVD